MPSRHSFREIALIAAATALSGGPHRRRDQTTCDTGTAGRPRDSGTAGRRKVRSAFLYPPGFGGEPLFLEENTHIYYKKKLFRQSVVFFFRKSQMEAAGRFK